MDYQGSLQVGRSKPSFKPAQTSQLNLAIHSGSQATTLVPQTTRLRCFEGPPWMLLKILPIPLMFRGPGTVNRCFPKVKGVHLCNINQKLQRNGIISPWYPLWTLDLIGNTCRLPGRLFAGYPFSFLFFSTLCGGDGTRPIPRNGGAEELRSDPTVGSHLRVWTKGRK